MIIYASDMAIYSASVKERAKIVPFFDTDIHDPIYHNIKVDAKGTIKSKAEMFGDPNISRCC